MIRQSLPIGVVIFVLVRGLFPAESSAGDLVAPGWERSFQAGYTDPAGHYVGGATIMHLVAHNGMLFAADAYWCDSRNIWYGGTDPTTGWAQILRLDKPGGKWVVDLELGRQFLRPEILKSVTFATDGAGKPLDQPVNLLLSAAFSPRPGNVEVALFTRDDATGKWAKSIVYAGPKAKEQGEFSVRAMCVHRDKVTGVDRLFLSIGKLGIFSGVFDPAAPGKVKWSGAGETGPVETRPLAITEANGDLVFSSGRKIYRRIDGDKPSYQIIADLSDIFPNVIAAAGFYAGSIIAIRDAAGKYRLTEVNGPAGAGKPPLVATYCFADSPFSQDHGQVIYFGGLDANSQPAHNLAWIFDTRLGDFLRAAAPNKPAEEPR